MNRHEPTAYPTPVKIAAGPLYDALRFQSVLTIETVEAALYEHVYKLWEARGMFGCPEPEMHEDPHDEYHTMSELYEYRMLYNAAFVNATHMPVVKSWRHSDGEPCFGGGWFVVVVTLPTGQVSNHYRSEFWDMFKVPEGVPPTYDGHTPQDAATRMRRWLSRPQRTHAEFARPMLTALRDSATAIDCRTEAGL